MYKFVNIRCPSDIWVKLKQEAERLDRTVTWVVLDAVKKYLGIK